jgi:aspartate/methionine/tyrosine aminotransferase
LALTFLRDHGIHTLYVSAPGYFATFQVCKHLGLRAEIIPPKDFLTCQLDYDRIAQALHTPGSALTLTNPAYSVGVEYSPSDLARLFAVIPEQTYVLLDEVYSGLNWEHDEPWMPYDSPCRVMILRSPSKTFLMYGSKLCFLVAPPAVIQYVETLAEFLSSLPGNFENIALEYLYALSAWEQENLQPGNGTYRRWKAQTTVCFTRNLQRLIPLLEEFRFLVAPINSGPYVTVATERARLNGFDPVALARQHGVLFMTSQHYFHEDPHWFGFRLNLCGDSHEFDKALRSVLPLFLTR